MKEGDWVRTKTKGQILQVTRVNIFDETIIYVARKGGGERALFSDQYEPVDMCDCFPNRIFKPNCLECVLKRFP